MITVTNHRGVFLPEIDLWLDPHGARSRAFVSHAHADHFSNHEWILASEASTALMNARYGGKSKREVVSLGYHEVFEHRGFEIRLLPAGHILGSAQIHLTRKSDGATLLYTGDFKLRDGLAAEPTEWLKADILIMETTFGRPHFRFPPNEQIHASIVKFAQEALEEGDVPLLLGYSLGKAQEILATLKDAGLPIALHPTVEKMTQIYEDFGYTFPEWEKLEAKDTSGKVIIAPPTVSRSQAIRRIKNRRMAMMSGWAMTPGAKYRYQVDDVFPLSDHADYTDLLNYVELVQPKRVLTLHGFAADFAADLRNRGIEAWNMFGDDQMELSMDFGNTRILPNVYKTDSAPESGFGQFTSICEEIAGVSGKLRKTALLAKYLEALSDQNLAIASVFLTGRALTHQKRDGAINAGRAVIKAALLEASQSPEQKYREISRIQNDGGRTAYLLLQGKTTPKKTSLVEIRDFFESMRSAKGPAAKTALLAERLQGLSPIEGKFIVSILSGDLRIGLKEGLLEEAISEAFAASAAEVREAHMLIGDLGETALLARHQRLSTADLSPGTPIKCMLASPEEDAEGIWKRLGSDGSVWLEDKFDGIRAQLHKSGDKVQLFSRDLRPLKEFPEMIPLAQGFEDDVILDGELIAHAQGKRLTFFDLQKRLGRKREPDLFLGESIPVQFVAFDLLWKNGTSFFKEPLHKRRKALEDLQLPSQFKILDVVKAHSAAEVEAAFKAARDRKNEGLIAKEPASLYLPGRRGKSWLKLKKAFSTLDVVVVKAQQGHGKRNHVLSDYTFALRDSEAGDALLVIGKAYTGLTDLEIEELTEHFKLHTISVNRRVHTVEPNIVLEIAFDSINASKRHNSGMALRFPRIKAIRRDKAIADIDTVQYARKLAGF